MTREDGSDPVDPDTSADPTKLADSEAATVLAEEDDRTQVVSGRTADAALDETVLDETVRAGAHEQPTGDALAATRVIDPQASLEDDSASDERATGSRETRVLDNEEDKTQPPPVAPPRDQRPPAGPRPPPARTPGASDQGLEPGMILFGEYEIVNVLGVGGMGEVYRARHRRLEEHRAIKVMHADLSSKKGASEFFYREAKALLAVRHPAVVHCHDLLSDDSGRVYLIMEMIEGIPLSKKMNDGPLSPDDVAILGARIAHGLSAAHRKGVIHRDVSPDNIVLPNGRVQDAKLIDFGIAKILEEGEGTILDGFKGKLSYASPEQLGFFGGKLDGRSDFYSLGLVLAAAALGRPMGMGTTVMEAVDARRGFQTLPDGIPMGLRSAIQPLLALDPKDRPKYVDRLFVVPGSVDNATDSGVYRGIGAGAHEAPAARATGNRIGLFAGLGAGLAALVATGLYVAWPADTTDRNAVAPPASRIVAPVEQADVPPVAPVAEVPVDEPPKKAPAPLPPKTHVLTARDRIKIIGLLNGAKLALDDNRLMSPANDNAYDRYRKVLDLEPKNGKALEGLREVASRYLGLADAAHSKGDLGQAREYLARAEKADPNIPGLAATRARLTR